MVVAAAAITPTGVRDGELATLRALSIRRGAAVLSYCEQVCLPDHALDAATEAFARFRAAVVAAPRLDEIDPEAMLLSATRHAAAERAPAPPPSGRPGLRAPGSRSCPLMPELLAARADDQLSAADVQRSARHLRRCRHCQEAEHRWRSAEIAYRAAAPDAPAELAVEAIERALRTAVTTISQPPPRGPDDHHHAAATPWPVPPLAVAEPPELPATVAPAPEDRAAPEPSEPSAPLSTPADLDPSAAVAMAWPSTAVDASEVEPSWGDAPEPPFEHEHEHGDDDYSTPLNTHPLDHDPDATMAWALDAPDFDGEIRAADLRDRSALAVPAVPAAPGVPAAPAAPGVPAVPAASVGRQRRTRRPTPFMRPLLPLAIAAVIVLVALSLVGSLANSDHHRSVAPRAAPTVAPAGVGSSAIVTPLKHPHHGRTRRRAPTAGANASAIPLGPLASAGQTQSVRAAPQAEPAPARATPVLTSPPSPRSSPTAPAATPTAPRQAPVANTPVTKTSPTPPTGTGTPPSAPAGATPPATPGANPPSASTSPGGTAAPAP